MTAESVEIRPRPDQLPADVFRIETPDGTAFMAVTLDEEHNPFEVFIHFGKGGSTERGAAAEAIGRLTTVLLRTAPSEQAPAMLGLIVDQLKDIGGGDSIGFGPKRECSLPDAVAQVLGGYIGPDEEGETLHGDRGNILEIETDLGDVTVGLFSDEKGFPNELVAIFPPESEVDNNLKAITLGICELFNNIMQIGKIENGMEKQLKEAIEVFRQLEGFMDPQDSVRGHPTLAQISGQIARKLEILDILL